MSLKHRFAQKLHDARARERDAAAHQQADPRPDAPTPLVTHLLDPATLFGPEATTADALRIGLAFLHTHLDAPSPTAMEAVIRALSPHELQRNLLALQEVVRDAQLLQQALGIAIAMHTSLAPGAPADDDATSTDDDATPAAPTAAVLSQTLSSISNGDWERGLDILTGMGGLTPPQIARWIAAMDPHTARATADTLSAHVVALTQVLGPGLMHAMTRGGRQDPPDEAHGAAPSIPHDPDAAPSA